MGIYLSDSMILFCLSWDYGIWGVCPKAEGDELEMLWDSTELGDRRGGGCHLARWLLRKITGGDPPGIKELRGDLPMSYHSPGPAVDSRP